eukprot:TRINITY_DN8842_c0_g1_i1.p1 TRINITY_DN8842_c0_g1~~TRINITY_DN8842_c0_g1_i1.p1  ORF type:complete len:646 (-),score=120.72 TRINITY_DN8842_c0_g1_i1:158-2095(-)
MPPASRDSESKLSREYIILSQYSFRGSSKKWLDSCLRWTRRSGRASTEYCVLRAVTVESSLVQSRISGFLGQTVMGKEFSHTVLHNQNALRPQAVPPSVKPPGPCQVNERQRVQGTDQQRGNNYQQHRANQYKEPPKAQKQEAIPQRAKEIPYQPKPSPYQPKEFKANPCKPKEPPRLPQEMHQNRERREEREGNKGIVNYHYKKKENENQNKKPQNYYDQVWKQMEERRRIAKVEHKQKPLMQENYVERKVAAKPPKAPSRPITEEKPRPPPNFYVHNYQPYKCEELHNMQIIPAPKKCPPAEAKKKLKELKEKARKREEEKKEVEAEKKKREEERSERVKKREEERRKMRNEIEKRRRGNRPVKNEELRVVQNPVVGEAHKAEAKKHVENTKSSNVCKPAKEPEAKSELKEKSKKKRKSKKKVKHAKHNKFSKEPVLVLYKPKPQSDNIEEKHEVQKDKINPETKKQGADKSVSSEDIKEERNKQEKRDTPEFANGKKVQDKAVNLKVTSRSIKDQVDFLTKSIFSRQQAKIKEEQQLEEDMQRLAREYQEVCFGVIVADERSVRREEGALCYHPFNCRRGCEGGYSRTSRRACPRFPISELRGFPPPLTVVDSVLPRNRVWRCVHACVSYNSESCPRAEGRN